MTSTWSSIHPLNFSPVSFYNGLPEENKAAAPEAWEAIWVKDLKDLEDGLSLDRENYDEVCQVLEYAVKKKDKHGVRIGKPPLGSGYTRRRVQPP
jgi:hypothetical protein